MRLYAGIGINHLQVKRTSPKIEIKRSVRDVEQFVSGWEEMGSIFRKCITSLKVTEENGVEFRRKLDELVLRYPKISDLVSRYAPKMEHYDPALGIHITDYNPITHILMDTTSLRNIVMPTGLLIPSSPSISDFSKKWHNSRSMLLYLLGALKTKIHTIGKVTLTEVLRIRELENKLGSIDDFIFYVENIGFLRLGSDWSLATIALQIQEVATMKIAERLGINLEKPKVESILGVRIDEKDFGFVKQYEALSKKVKEIKGVELPNLTTKLRSVRVDILHRGYNPQPKEVTGIVEFTKGFLNKLKELHK